MSDGNKVREIILDERLEPFTSIVLEGDFSLYEPEFVKQKIEETLGKAVKFGYTRDRVCVQFRDVDSRQNAPEQWEFDEGIEFKILKPQLDPMESANAVLREKIDNLEREREAFKQSQLKAQAEWERRSLKWTPCSRKCKCPPKRMLHQKL